jgi:glutamate synthase domain-containing protein 1
LDNVLEFLVLSGYSLSHAMMMLVPEAWETQADMSPEKRAFYEYHEHLMEPWDGPAALAFTGWNPNWSNSGSKWAPSSPLRGNQG